MSQQLLFSSLLVDEHHPRRAEVEAHISARYQHAFHADIPEFMPFLVAIINEQQQLCSACGFRVALHEPLYLEHYLDAPVEHVLARHYRYPIAREQVVEIGQLASFSKGAAPVQFLAVARLLVNLGYQWCVFTATGPLFAMMTRMGLALAPMVAAAGERVGEDFQHWGEYYQHQPRVAAGSLTDGLAVLEQYRLHHEHRGLTGYDARAIG